MKRTRYFLLGLVAMSISALVLFSNLSPVVSQSTVQWQSEPLLEQVIPNETLVKLNFQAVDQENQPLSDANIQVRLLTPKKTPWFSSDFPIVEGTELLNLEAIAPQSNLELEQVFPIRGQYVLNIVINPQSQGAFEPFEQSFTLNVSENSIKYLNFAILVAILLVLGVAGGWVLGGDQIVREDEIAPQPIRLFLSGMIIVAIVVLLFVNISAELALHNHHHHHHNQIASTTPNTASNQEIKVELLGDTHAVVGKLSTQAVQVNNPNTQEAITDVQIAIESMALEHEHLIFAYQGIPDENGRLTWSEQFFDGAPHKVTATVAPLKNRSVKFAPLQVSQTVDVEGIAPPMFTRLISLLYFTLIFVVGLIAGFWGRRRKKKPVENIAN